MPLFRNKRKENNKITQTNTSPSGPLSPTSPLPNGTLQRSLPASISPLANFIPPPDVVADALAKSSPKSTSSLAEVVGWAKGYFSAFLADEGVEDLLGLWDMAKNCNNTADNQDGSHIKSLRSKAEMVLTKVGGEELVDSIVKEEGELSGEWVQRVEKMAYEIMQETYFPKYLESKYHVKCQLDLFTNGGNISLYDILLNHSALFYFMEYTEQEGKREVLEFWLGANNFSEQFSNGANVDVKTAISDAMVLYERYISLQASQPLGLRDEIRSEVEAKICSHDEISHCFNTAVIEAFAFLHVTCFEGFLNSSLFLTFLSDLISSLNTSTKSQQALDSSSIASSGSFVVTSDSSLASPVPLRERDKVKLSLGRVSALGRFEADTDLDMFKKESGIKKNFKKLVNLEDKEKAKEELAWQVAAMIINEVTSVTMGPGLNQL